MLDGPGAIAGGAVGRSIGSAVYKKIQDLAAARVAAADAISAVQGAQQTAAEAIKATPRQTPAEVGPQPLLPQRQLPAASPVITAGPITAREDIGNPPVTSISDTSTKTSPFTPVPTDPLTGRPMDRTYPVEGTPAPVQVPVATLDELAQGYVGKLLREGDGSGTGRHPGSLQAHKRRPDRTASRTNYCSARNSR